MWYFHSLLMFLSQQDLTELIGYSMAVGAFLMVQIINLQIELLYLSFLDWFFNVWETYSKEDSWKYNN